MVIPNFFIVGAPKCGTTALYTYLKDHPSVFLSQPKEPHYFCTDFPRFRRVTSRRKYDRLFQTVQATHRAVGEASVFYLCSEQALTNIREFNPRAKIVAILRQPIDMAHSLHSQFVYGFLENETDFERAWHFQADRSQGRRIPRNCIEPKHLQYGRMACFGEQIERLFQLFPTEQIKVLVHDDLKDVPRKMYREVLQFLDIADDGRKEFGRINANKVHRFPRLAEFAMHLPFPLNAVKATTKTMLGRSHFSMSRKLYMSLTKCPSRKPLREEFRQQLMAFYHDDIRKLEQLLNRDLTRWLA